PPMGARCGGGARGLADPARAGGGIGSRGLDAAAGWLAAGFRELGAEPLGGPGVRGAAAEHGPAAGAAGGVTARAAASHAGASGAPAADAAHAPQFQPFDVPVAPAGRPGDAAAPDRPPPP